MPMPSAPGKKGPRILLTSVGNQASPMAQNWLRAAFPGCRLVGLDIRDDAHGLYACDRAYLAPRLDSAEYEPALRRIMAREGVECVFPLSTKDQDWFSARRGDLGVPVVCSSAQAVAWANHKGRLFDKLAEVGIPALRYRRDAARGLDWARGLGGPFVVKPSQGTGGSGLRIVAAEPGLIRPDDRKFFLAADEFWADPPRYLAADIIFCEYLSGSEYSVDILSQEGRFLYGVVRKRFTSRGGMSMHARVVDEPDVLAIAQRIVAELGLGYINNIQLKRDAQGSPKIMEINPRIPGTLELSLRASGNMIGDAVRLALGLPVEPPGAIAFGAAIYRHWDGIIVMPGAAAAPIPWGSL